MKSFLLRLCLPVETLNAQIGALHFLQYLTHISVECIGHLGVDSRISNDTTTYYVTNVTVLRGAGVSKSSHCMTSRRITRDTIVRFLIISLIV